MSRRILLFVLIGLLASVVGFVTFTPAQAVTVVRNYGYWVVFTAFVLFAWHLSRSLRDEWPRLRKVGEWWRAGLLIVTATGFLHLHEQHEFKIVADEVVLSSTAMQMHFARESAVVLRGYEFAGNFLPMQVFLDKRPLFFPFLLSLVHDCTGYRVENVFVLNALVSLALTTLFYLLGRRIGGTSWAGVAGVLLLCSVPLVAQNAVGGGFELLNVTMIALTLWLGLRYVERPDADRLCAFLLSGVLLAQTRYESILFIAPVAATIFYLWWRERRVDLPWTLLISPLLLLIYPLQHNVFKLSDASWQLNDVAGATSPFALRYFYDNVGHALNFFFCFDGTQPSSWPMAVMGMVAVGFFVLTLYKQHRQIFTSDPACAVTCIFLTGLLLHTGVMLCYFWGKWDDPIIRRLSLPAHLLLILATLFVLPRLIPHPRRWLGLSVLTAVSIVGLTVPVAAMHRFTQDNFAARTTNWLGSYIRHMGDKTVLAIDNNAGLQWFLYRKSSINPLAFANRTEAFSFHFKNHSFNEYLVVQRAGVDLKTGARFVSAEDDLGPGVTLELIEEKAFSPVYLVRLSRVVAIDEAKLKTWAEERKKLQKVLGASSSSLIVVGVSDPEQLVIWLRNLP
ncbi:MAG: glycosyltransferase family 39 protein [Verrucomicrobia bacterium]|nr:glycosyltransferase family 39 protein [Verrucomicrobiota bacterium]